MFYYQTHTGMDGLNRDSTNDEIIKLFFLHFIEHQKKSHSFIYFLHTISV